MATIYDTSSEVPDDLKTSKQVVEEFAQNIQKYYSSLAERYGGRLWRYKVGSLILSTAVTVMSGIGWFKCGNYSWTITVVAGLSTLVAGVLTATKIEEYYIMSAALHALVQTEKLNYVAGAGRSSAFLFARVHEG